MDTECSVETDAHGCEPVCRCGFRRQHFSKARAKLLKTFIFNNLSLFKGNPEAASGKPLPLAGKGGKPLERLLRQTKKGPISSISGLSHASGRRGHGSLVANDPLEIHRFAGMGMQLGANVLEHRIVFLVHPGDRAELRVQAVLLGDPRGIAGEVEGGIARQLEGVAERLAVDLAVHVEVHIGAGFGVLPHLVADMDIDVLLVEAGQADQMEVAWFERKKTALDQCNVAFSARS